MKITQDISVVIPALNAEARIAACLTSLAVAKKSGLIAETLVVDAGSTDRTVEIAQPFSAKIISAPPGRGGQLQKGAAAAKAAWLLFLHADTALGADWEKEVFDFIHSECCEVGTFTLRFDQPGVAPSIVAKGAMIRTKICKLPYGDQGLLISRRLYNALGGYHDMPLFEDVDLMQRLRKIRGRRALHVFHANAITSAERYERAGYARQVAGNMWRLLRYSIGVAPKAIAKTYS